MGFLYRKFQGGEETEQEDILRNLGYVLAAKREDSSHFPDFGLGEPIHGSPEAAIEAFSAEIRASIARYEPRVRVVEIEVLGDEGPPRLGVHLELRRTGERLSLAVDRDSGASVWSGEEES